MKKSANLEMLFTEKTFLERFQCAKDAGFDAVEFAGWLEKDMDAVINAARQADIPIAAFTGDELYSPIDGARQQEYIELVCRSADMARRAGARMLVTHSNALGAKSEVLCRHDELTATKKLLNMYDTYKKLAPHMERAGIILLVEAISGTEHPGVFMEHVDLAAEIVETVGSPNVRLLCDLYHMQQNGGRLVESLRRYRGITGHIHFADVPGRHEPGTGEINFAAIKQCLTQMDYQGMVGFALQPSEGTERAVRAIMRY
ncbi:TIM barrel protein [Agathobaculum sp. NTUH-O15-33]|uniref:TIM barrel protein n=1 Tax=Agathobaculum sp. NTUH-O15-33 TaxID=3079302 RepID=UPI002958942C|nr:TIM barrel protein [Agathobaculum sp. NTUH-O15-33]WNX83527.1 TIM barrel protein [Agathobaculum sp. NTUH-O15-33]